MSKKNTTTAAETGLVIHTPVQIGIEAVNEKLKSLKKIVESVYKTSGTLPGFTNKVQNETDELVLGQMGSSIQGRARGYTDFMNSIGKHHCKAFKVGGHTEKEWISDIELRLQIIEHKETYDKLNEIKKGYEELMDKEDKLALLNKKIAEL